MSRLIQRGDLWRFALSFYFKGSGGIAKCMGRKIYSMYIIQLQTLEVFILNNFIFMFKKTISCSNKIGDVMAERDSVTNLQNRVMID